MIQMPLQDMINKIVEEAGVTEEQVNEKIKQKLDQLSGLISKEGAAHIIANELNVKLVPQKAGVLKLKDLLVGMRDIETAGKVVNNFGMREFQVGDRTGKVANLVIADETGSIKMVCWGEQAAKAGACKEGDIIKIAGAYMKVNQGNNEVHMNDRSLLTINPEGIKIDVAAGGGSAGVQRKKIEELAENDQNVELLATIVQVFDPKFFEVCPECGKRTKQSEDGSFNCFEHGRISPAFSYLINTYLDDGSGNIQAVFFRNLFEDLADKKSDQLLQYKDNPSAVDQLKTDLLGNMIKVSGRINKNSMFERLEFVVQSVDINPDPEEELKALDSQQKGSPAEQAR